MSHYSNPSLSTKSLVRVLADARAHQRVEGSTVPRQHHHRLPISDVDRLVEAYSRGVSAKDLAAEFAVHGHTVTSLLLARGVSLRLRGLRPEDVEPAARLYRDGWSLVRLSEKFGVDGSTVWRALLKIGIVMRSPNS